MKTAIIIPCYNEEDKLNTKTFTSFINTYEKYHLCFVNDGSSDNTIELLKKIQNNNEEKVSIVDVKKKKGKEAAIRSGTRYLFNKKDVDYIGYIDTDLSTNIDEFKTLVNQLEKYNALTLVYKSRNKKSGGNNTKKRLRDAFSIFISSLLFNFRLT
jgi:glycosyltransferase involved in cell wall biosynthesis